MLTFANVKMQLAMIQSSLANPMNDASGLCAGLQKMIVYSFFNFIMFE
jgi:hypothetical protein